MWHVSISRQTRTGPVDDQAMCERRAIAVLQRVGGPREWWYWNPAVRVGHLRVGVTPAEYLLVPPGCARDDAGETGPERPRSR